MYHAELGQSKVDEQQQQNLPDDSAADSANSSGLTKNLVNEDDLKASYVVDSPVCCFIIFFIRLSFLYDIMLMLHGLYLYIFCWSILLQLQYF